jgi:hypothetical protein
MWQQKITKFNNNTWDVNLIKKKKQISFNGPLNFCVNVLFMVSFFIHMVYKRVITFKSLKVLYLKKC